MTMTFLGLGNMGGPMAANLAEAGEDVLGYDPVVTDAGVPLAGSAVGAAEGADVVITMLPSGRHVLDVYREVVPVARPGALFLDCSTIDIGDAVRRRTGTGGRAPRGRRPGVRRRGRRRGRQAHVHGRRR
jgi:3-hydroxyisobutyrate dehydrogenase